MLARLFVIIGGLIVLALTVALVGPYFIDWTNYKADFEREASSILGRSVTVRGEASAKLLPFPSVTFTDVAIAGGPGGEPAMTVETFSMDAELAPFMRGDFAIFDMRLVKPKGTIDVAADGTVDWTARPAASFNASRVSLEKLTVTEGQIAIRHGASGRIYRLTEINSEISAKSLEGPWRANGSARLDGMLTELSVSTGKADANGGMRLRVRADPAGYPLAVEADGNIRLVDHAAHYDGQFKLIERLEPAPAKMVSSAQDPGYRMNGKFSLDHTRLSLDEFRFETGPLDNPYSADGMGFIDFGQDPHFGIVANGAQMRFDDAVGAEGKGGGLTLGQRLAALEMAVAALPRPSMPGTVDVNLPAVVAGDTTIRDVRLSAGPVEGGWTVKSFAATLPGRTKLEADGVLATDGRFGFTGAMTLAIGQPSGFAAWVSKDVDDAIRRLPAAGFHADVDLTSDRQTFKGLELGLGDATFRGEAESRQPMGGRPATVLRLAGGALDVDGLAAFASLFVSDSGASRFADRDLDLTVKAGPVNAGGLTADTVDAAFRLRDGQLEIDKMSIGGMAGATISATGTIKGFPDNPAGTFDASLVSTDLAPLFEAAALRFKENAFAAGLHARAAAYPGLFEDARVDLVATAAANGDGTTGIAISAQGKAGGTALSATLSGTGQTEAPRDAKLTLSVSGRNPDATALLALYGLPALPLGMTGAGDAELSAKGTLSGGLETSASLKTHDMSAGFTGTALLGETGVTANGTATLETADIEPWLRTTGVGMPGMGMGLPLELSAELDFADGTISFRDLSGAVVDGAVSGDVVATLRDGKPHLTGSLALDQVDLTPLAAMVVGEPALESDGVSWPSVPFAQKGSAPFTAELNVAAATVDAGPLLSAYDASLLLKLDDAGLQVSNLSAKLYGGAVSGLFELKNNEGTGLLTGQVKLVDADIETVLPGTGLSGAGDFSAALSASGKSVGGLVAALSGSGTTALKTLKISGLNPEAFAAFITRADAIGRDIDAEKTAGFAPGIATAGTFAVAPTEVAFTVAGGVLRAPPLKLDNPAASVEVDLQADLNSFEIAANGMIAYQPGQEALVGSDPALRFSLRGAPGAIERSFDSAPLTQFLTQRALEIEQMRVEALQAALLEKQRLRREVRYYAALQTEREQAAREQAARDALKAQQEAERAKAEAEVLAREDAARKAQQAAERAKAEAEAQAREDAARKARQAAEEKAKADLAEARARLAQEEKAKAESLIERAPLPLPEMRPLPPAPIDAPATPPPVMDGFLQMLQGE